MLVCFEWYNSEANKMLTFASSIRYLKATPEYSFIRDSSKFKIGSGSWVLAELITDVFDLRTAQACHIKVGGKGHKVKRITSSHNGEGSMIAGENLLLVVLLGSVAVGALATPLAEGPEIHTTYGTRIRGCGCN